MYQLPQTGYLRLPQIIGNAKAEPPTPALIPVSKSTWWDGVKSGRFPKRLQKHSTIAILPPFSIT